MGVAFAKPSAELVNKIVVDHDADIVVHAGDIGVSYKEDSAWLMLLQHTPMTMRSGRRGLCTM